MEEELQRMEVAIGEVEGEMGRLKEMDEKTKVVDEARRGGLRLRLSRRSSRRKRKSR